MFAIAEVVQPFYRADRALSDPYSSYAVGKYGLVQTIAFIALSAASFALSFGLSRFEWSGAAWRFGRVLLMLWSVGVLAAAIFPIAGGPLPGSANIHSIASMLAFLSIVAAMFVLSKAFKGNVEWRRFAFSSWMLAFAAGGSFFLAASIHHPACFAILQRLFLGAVVLWRIDEVRVSVHQFAERGLRALGVVFAQQLRVVH
jgi:Protein of unknown function (DUF998)